jgi:hypothetical protein
MNTVQLEGQLSKSKQKIFGTEEQLRKLEHKVSISDVNVANQVSVWRHDAQHKDTQ